MSAAVLAQPQPAVLSMAHATFESCEAYNNSNYHVQAHHNSQAAPYPKDPWADRSANSGAVNFDDVEDEEELSPARLALAKAAAGCPVMCDFLRVLVIHRLRMHEGCGELDAKAHAERVVSGVRDDNRLMILYALMVFNEVKFY